jgi:hypothetical protein
VLNSQRVALAVVVLGLVGGACGSTPSAPTVPLTPAALQSVTLAANLSAVSSIGQTAQATATGGFSDGTSKDVSATCTNWQSDNASVLTVNSTGLLTAQGGGSAAVTTTCQGIAARAVLTIAFKPAAPLAPSTFTLSGTVTDASSRGVLPRIYLQITDGTNHGRYTQSDAAGIYSLDGLSVGTFTLTISAVSYITTTQSVTFTADTRLDVVLARAAPPTFTLSGTITDGSSGAMLPNVSVQITGGANHGRSTRTDATGTYRLDGLSAGTVTLTMSAVTYITTTESVGLTQDTRLDVVLAHTPRPYDGSYPYTLVVILPPSCSLTGVESRLEADAVLAVNGDLLSFDLPSGGLILHVRLQRSGSRLSGTIDGFTRGPITVFTIDGTLAGTDSDNGNLAGTFTGTMLFFRTLPDEYTCSVSAAPWSLTPR